jgi:hypothetical protein
MTTSDVTLLSDIPEAHPHKASIESALIAAYSEKGGGPWTISVATREGAGPNEWVVRVKSPRSISISNLYADRPAIATDRIRQRAAEVLAGQGAGSAYAATTSDVARLR